MTQDTRTCTNGHTMTGIGFDNCPECDAPWNTNTMTQDIPTVEEIVKSHRPKLLPTRAEMDAYERSIILALTKAIEEVRRNTEIELRTKYIVVSKDVQAQHEQQIIEKARREERERIVVWIGTKRKTKRFPQQLIKHDHTVEYFDRLSDADIHYNEALDDLLQLLSDK